MNNSVISSSAVRVRGGSGVGYLQALAVGRRGWWRGLLALVAFVLAYLVVSALLGGIAIAVDLASGQTSPDQLAAGGLPITPTLFLANNVSLALCLPIAMLLQWAFFGVRPRWLSSVEGRFRWRLMGRFALVVVPIWLVYVAGMAVLGGEPLGGPVSAASIALTAIVLLTTPLQAAGEEYGFRGLIGRSVGSWFASPMAALMVGTFVSSVAFTLAHGASDPWLTFYYFSLGAALCFLAWRTGGLEGSVLIHATNNVLFLLPTVLFGDLNSIFERGTGAGGPEVLIGVGVVWVVAIALSWWATRSGVVRLAPTPPSRTTPPHNPDATTQTQPNT
jgi:membrane protease YdiL (CAAX protease family)